MYNEQIENLINLVLADGELTEKEKQILFKKAEAAGIDLDEFEIVLDAKLFEKQQTAKVTAPSVAAPKSDKLGDIKNALHAEQWLEHSKLSAQIAAMNFQM